MQIAVLRYRVLGEVVRLTCEKSNIGTKFKLEESKEGGARF